MGDYCFGVGVGKVAAKTESACGKIAKRHGCYFVAMRDGNTYRYWFAGPNRGEPFDRQMAAAVREDIAAAEIELP